MRLLLPVPLPPLMPLLVAVLLQVQQASRLQLRPPAAATMC
jgi:hypothetical protein